jgi:hypothetical protein
MPRIEWPIRFPNSIDEMKQFPHAVAQGDIASFSSRALSLVQSPNRRIVQTGAFRSHPQVMSDQVVALRADPRCFAE